MSARFCHACGAAVQTGAGFCTACGTTLAVAAPAPAPGHAAHAMAPPPTYQTGPKPVTQGMAIAALVLNIIVWPGLGSLIAGRQIGWAQGFLFLVGLPLCLILIGIPVVIGAWVWGLVTGVQLVQESNATMQNPR